jgi:hypothetical protein
MFEIRINDAPRQDLIHFKEYVYRIRIEKRPDATLEEHLNRRSLLLPSQVPFIEFDLPAHIVAPGCEQNWQKALAVQDLKRTPEWSARWLIQQAVDFGVLGPKSLPSWARTENILTNVERKDLGEQTGN